MYRHLILAFTLLLTPLVASDSIFTSPKIALKMIDKKDTIFLSLDRNTLKIKNAKYIDMKLLESSDVFGDIACSPFYVCEDTIKKYFSSLGIEPEQSLVIYDNSYGINAATLYVVLESMGQKNISILRGTVEDIANLDPNWKTYHGYLKELKSLDSNGTSLKQKINILKPRLLLQDYNMTEIKNVESSYEITEKKSDYFVSKNDLQRVVKKVRTNESNTTIIDACEMIDIVGDSRGSYISGVKPLSWKSLIDKKTQHLKSTKELEMIFDDLKLEKSNNNYVYCMSSAKKSFFVMMALREVGYSRVKAFVGDWNSWEGDIDE